MNKFKLFFMMFLSAGLLLTACSDDDDDEPATTTNNNNNNNTDPNIAEIVINSSDHDSLEKAVLRFNDIANLLSNAGTYTVFAPTDAAFARLLGGGSIDGLPDSTLRAILTYHVLGVEVPSSALADYTYASTLSPAQGNFLSVKADVTGGVRINNTANVTSPDLAASNGVVHVIDQVLSLPNVVDLAQGDDRFDSLVVALTTYPASNYVQTLEGDGPFTVFAPTNQAFADLIANNTSGWTSISQIPQTVLENVLNYHVVSGNVQSGDLDPANNPIQTLNMMATLDFDNTNGAQLLTGDTAQGPVNIIITDVQGTNGIVHAVDAILLP